MSVFDTFLYANDFHNLKAAIKQVYLNKEIPNIYITHGTIAVDLIIRAVKEHDFSILPEYMQLCAEEAYYVQFNFESKPEVITELERIYRITDDIMKYIIVKKG